MMSIARIAELPCARRRLQRSFLAQECRGMRLPLLIFHISAGVLAMLAGAAAISFRKGSRWHGRTGNIFVAAWATARHRDGETGILNWLGFLFALAFGALSVFHGFLKITGREPLDPGTYPFMQLFIGSLLLLAAFGDLRVIVRGISGKQRIARHLWRMCFGWFIATGSFFLGQQQVFPVWLQGSPVLMVPALLPLVLLIFWMIRVRFTGAYKRMATPRASEALSLRA